MLHVAPQARDLATRVPDRVLPIPDQHRTTLFRPGRAHALLAAWVVLRSIRDDGMDVEGVVTFARRYYTVEPK